MVLELSRGNLTNNRLFVRKRRYGPYPQCALWGVLANSYLRQDPRNVNSLHSFQNYAMIRRQWSLLRFWSFREKYLLGVFENWLNEPIYILIEHSNCSIIIPFFIHTWKMFIWKMERFSKNCLFLGHFTMDHFGSSSDCVYPHLKCRHLW